MAPRSVWEPFPIFGMVYPAVAFKAGGNVATAKEFVRFLVSEGWLMHYLDFSGERMLPPITKLLEQPLWLDPQRPAPNGRGDADQLAPDDLSLRRGRGRLARRPGRQERVWAKAIHRVAAEGITPEQAVDQAILRIKQILSE